MSLRDGGRRTRSSPHQGATKGALEWTDQKITDVVKQFKDRKLAFIRDPENIKLVKEERRSSEYSILKAFLQGWEYGIQVQMGLALRQIADDPARVRALTDRIQQRYGTKGLHIAEITEIGITTQLLSHLTELYREL